MRPSGSPFIIVNLFPFRTDKTRIEFKVGKSHAHWSDGVWFGDTHGGKILHVAGLYVMLRKETWGKLDEWPDRIREKKRESAPWPPEVTDEMS